MLPLNLETVGAMQVLFGMRTRISRRNRAEADDVTFSCSYPWPIDIVRLAPESHGSGAVWFPQVKCLAIVLLVG